MDDVHAVDGQIWSSGSSPSLSVVYNFQMDLSTAGPMVEGESLQSSVMNAI